jgi:hypothetical protein
MLELIRIILSTVKNYYFHVKIIVLTRNLSYLEKQGDFVEMTIDDVDTQNTSYDFVSVMHYSTYEFSKNGLPTIEALQPNTKLSQLYSLTRTDIKGVQLYYNCKSIGSTLPPTTSKYILTSRFIICKKKDHPLIVHQEYKNFNLSLSRFYQILNLIKTYPFYFEHTEPTKKFNPIRLDRFNSTKMEKSKKSFFIKLQKFKIFFLF